MECETLDECFFGGRTSYFKENPFNEDICDDWHLYCVESCLNTRAIGNKVYVCGLHLIHYSSGTLSYKYSEDFHRLAKKYHKYFDRICTTCYEGNTDMFGRNYTLIKYNVSRIIKKFRKRNTE